MNLDQRIEEERKRVAGEVERLEKENEHDSKQLKELREEYNQALFESGAEEIDRVNENIKEVSSRIAQRRDKIVALQEDNPVIQKMLVDFVEESQAKKEELEMKAKKKHEKLKPIHEKLMGGLSELNQTRKEIYRLDSVIKAHSSQLNSKNQKALGIEGFYFFENKVVPLMNPLLIERGQVFKR